MSRYRYGSDAMIFHDLHVLSTAVGKSVEKVSFCPSLKQRGVVEPAKNFVTIGYEGEITYLVTWHRSLSGNNRKICTSTDSGNPKIPQEPSVFWHERSGLGGGVRRDSMLLGKQNKREQDFDLSRKKKK
jgi:hypothetical protein